MFFVTAITFLIYHWCECASRGNFLLRVNGAQLWFACMFFMVHLEFAYSVRKRGRRVDGKGVTKGTDTDPN